MAVPAVNITIEKGTNFEQDFIVKDANGAVVDLSNYTAVAKIRKYPSDSLSVQSFTVGITSLTGTITLSMSTTTTALLEDGRNYYDILATSPSNVVSKKFEGMAIVSPSVSV